jgi:predicted enzyme related to lactoylglutathione lyase
MINGVSNVGIEVDDQDRAKAFWIDRLGFELVQDTPYKEDGGRWLEVRTPDKAVVMGLFPRTGARPEPGDPRMANANVWFDCDDLQQTHAELTARGVAFTQAPVEMFFGWWSVFADTEGNTFALKQRAR